MSSPSVARSCSGSRCGMASGGVIARFRVQPFIATLAMMVFARGLAKLLSGGQKISTARPAMPMAHTSMSTCRASSTSSAPGSPATTSRWSRSSCWPRCASAASFSPAHPGDVRSMRWAETKRLPGTPASRSAATKVLAYGLCGLFCAVAGICQAAQELQGDPEAGTTYELSAIAMVVIGGTTPAGRAGLDLADAARRADHRQPRKDPEHQRRRRRNPPHADRPDHPGSGPVPERRLSHIASERTDVSRPVRSGTDMTCR